MNLPVRAFARPLEVNLTSPIFDLAHPIPLAAGPLPCHPYDSAASGDNTLQKPIAIRFLSL
jgi:hypothetical protein